jgi:hypothetical protein
MYWPEAPPRQHSIPLMLQSPNRPGQIDYDYDDENEDAHDEKRLA